MTLLKEPRVYQLLIARFFDGVSSGMFMLALPWIMLTMGDNGPLVALVALLCTLSSFLLTPIYATLIDRHSRKQILVVVQAIQAATALGLLVSTLLVGPSVISMAVAQWIYWISSDVGWTTNNALTQENFAPDEYPQISSYQEVILQGVTLGSGAVGVILLDLWDIERFALFAALVGLIALLAYLAMPYRRQLREHSGARFWGQLLESKAIFARRPGFFLFLAASCLSYPALTYLGKLVPIYLAEFNYEGRWFALWSTSYGLGALFCGFLAAWILHRFRHERLMIGAMTMLVLLTAVMALFTSPLVLVAATLIFGFFNALNRIARTNKMNLVITVHQRGRVDGGLKLFSTFSQSMSFVIISLLSHYQITEYGFAVISVTLGVAALYMALYQFRQRHLFVTEDETLEVKS